MNISLSDGGGDRPMMDDDDDTTSAIEEHQEILRNTGMEILGPPVLIPEGTDYPGSYQVWNPVLEGDRQIWVYIDTEGEAVRAAYPPFEVTG